ncbi:MAG: tRNA (adenosine(37)-N6)-threonylcarbamoyltransferase complex ATPase subunit type 1 TsaE [Bacteroidia bacterium]|nr:tRNA (adenosine(37)-N6)-threonylcarbamoyltransferase complex ATPase subunit type 1 TsaE [Bacteroidia bacterium]
MNSAEVLNLEIKDLTELPKAAQSLLDFADQRKIFLFYAPMGAGKTTLIKEMCKLLGSDDHFSSPTYSIINEYKRDGSSLYHFDLYRLKNAGELLDLGVEDYFDGQRYCFIEWPEFAEPFLDDNCVKIEISIKENIRYIRASVF